MSTQAPIAPAPHAVHWSSSLTAGAIACVTSLALVGGAAFFDAVTSSRLLLVLMLLLGVHILTCPRLLFSREFGVYSAFTAYLFIATTWAPDSLLALNTLFPAVDFVLIMVLFGSLVAFHDPRVVLGGALLGFWIGAAAYTYVDGFPFVTPDVFSYNGLAAMYLYGLFLTIAFGWASGMRMLTLALLPIVLLHIAATTSIKTNVGVLLGALGAAVMFSARTFRLLRRNLVFLGLGAAALAYLLITNEGLQEQIQYAFNRVSVGLEVLQAREDVPGYAGFNERQYWMQEGLRSWARNPFFGAGVEAFRVGFGITSHSTPVDLLYNTGLIGTGLFYGTLLLLAFRVFDRRSSKNQDLRAIVAAGIISYTFISLSGTVFYQSFLGAFVGISVALLRKPAQQNSDQSPRAP